MLNQIEKVEISCQCKGPNHVCRLILDKFKSESWPPELEIQVYLHSDMNFWNKLKACFKFLLQGQNLHWDEILVPSEQAQELYVLLHHWKVEVERWRQERNNIQ